MQRPQLQARSELRKFATRRTVARRPQTSPHRWRVNFQQKNIFKIIAKYPMIKWYGRIRRIEKFGPISGLKLVLQYDKI